MKPFSHVVLGCLVAAALACSNARNDDQTTAQAQAGNTYCFSCHSETTDLGKKVLWAQQGYQQSVHALGQVERVYTQFNSTGTAGTCSTATLTTQIACQSAGATWTGPTWILTGIENTGSNAAYANSSGCQACHTETGFRNRVSGAYDDPSYASIKFGWDPKAWAANTPLTRDVDLFPSPIGCFGCHTPHGVGSPDGQHLDQVVPVGTAVTTMLGAVYGNGTTGVDKAKGHLCAECHQVMTSGPNSVSAVILGAVTGASGKANIASYFGPHHGPQTDMLLGRGGAEYRGTVGAFTFAGTYGNSPHTTLRNADCVSCHLQSDYSDINVTGRFGVNPSIGGHSFTNRGFVHGAQQVLTIGCGSVTRDANGNVVQGCHTVSGVAGSQGSQVAAALIKNTTGYLQAGDAWFQKSSSPTAMVDTRYLDKFNELLVKLADPAKGCAGLLSQAASANATTIVWQTLPDGVTIDPRCIIAGSTGGFTKSASPVEATDPGARVLKAAWNQKFVYVEDKSFGVHNTTYALQLLYDSCADLTVLTGGTCGAAGNGQCAACNGTFVAGRP
jgi:hypothetical protein